jgi:hypothetical protein
MQDVFEPTANFGGDVFEPMNFDGDYSDFAVLNCGCKVKHPFNKGKRDACINECNKKKDAKKGNLSATAPTPAPAPASTPAPTPAPATTTTTTTTTDTTSEQTNPNEAPKSDKFLGMPRKVGVGVTIGIGVLAIGLTTFFLLRRK